MAANYDSSEPVVLKWTDAQAVTHVSRNGR